MYIEVDATAGELVLGDGVADSAHLTVENIIYVDTHIEIGIIIEIVVYFRQMSSTVRICGPELIHQKVVMGQFRTGDYFIGGDAEYGLHDISLLISYCIIGWNKSKISGYALVLRSLVKQARRHDLTTGAPGTIGFRIP
jgi:hypothetical protein